MYFLTLFQIHGQIATFFFCVLMWSCFCCTHIPAISTYSNLFAKGSCHIMLGLIQMASFELYFPSLKALCSNIITVMKLTYNFWMRMQFILKRSPHTIFRSYLGKEDTSLRGVGVCFSMYNLTSVLIDLFAKFFLITSDLKITWFPDLSVVFSQLLHCD